MEAGHLELSFHGMDPSFTVRRKVEQKIEKLKKRHPRVTSWHVYVQGPQGSSRKYEVTIEARVPGTELAVRANPASRNAHTQIAEAIRDAFRAIERQLEERSKKRRSVVKGREAQPQGRIARLFPEKGYGFIAVNEGGEVYFHQNSVVEADFSDLEVGDPVEVNIVENDAMKGPHASTVRRIKPLRYDPAQS
jgi:ribosomal subunit interface protein